MPFSSPRRSRSSSEEEALWMPGALQFRELFDNAGAALCVFDVSELDYVEEEEVGSDARRSRLITRNPSDISVGSAPVDVPREWTLRLKLINKEAERLIGVPSSQIVNKFVGRTVLSPPCSSSGLIESGSNAVLADELGLVNPHDLDAYGTSEGAYPETVFICAAPKQNGKCVRRVLLQVGLPRVRTERSIGFDSPTISRANGGPTRLKCFRVLASLQPISDARKSSLSRDVLPRFAYELFRQPAESDFGAKAAGASSFALGMLATEARLLHLNNSNSKGKSKHSKQKAKSTASEESVASMAALLVEASKVHDGDQAIITLVSGAFVFACEQQKAGSLWDEDKRSSQISVQLVEAALAAPAKNLRACLSKMLFAGGSSGSLSARDLASATLTTLSSLVELEPLVGHLLFAIASLIEKLSAKGDPLGRVFVKLFWEPMVRLPLSKDLELSDNSRKALELIDLALADVASPTPTREKDDLVGSAAETFFRAATQATGALRPSSDSDFDLKPIAALAQVLRHRWLNQRKTLQRQCLKVFGSGIPEHQAQAHISDVTRLVDNCAIHAGDSKSAARFWCVDGESEGSVAKIDLSSSVPIFSPEVALELVGGDSDAVQKALTGFCSSTSACLKTITQLVDEQKFPDASLLSRQVSTTAFTLGLMDLGTVASTLQNMLTDCASYNAAQALATSDRVASKAPGSEGAPDRADCRERLEQQIMNLLFSFSNTVTLVEVEAKRSREWNADLWGRLFSCSFDPFIVLARTGIIASLSRTACALTGLKENQVLGKNLLRELEFSDSDLAKLRAVYDGHSTSCDLVLSNLSALGQTPSASSVPISCILRLRQSSTNDCQLLVGTLSDPEFSAKEGEDEYSYDTISPLRRRSRSVDRSVSADLGSPTIFDSPSLGLLRQQRHRAASITPSIPEYTLDRPQATSSLPMAMELLQAAYARVQEGSDDREGIDLFKEASRLLFGNSPQSTRLPATAEHGSASASPSASPRSGRRSSNGRKVRRHKDTLDDDSPPPLQIDFARDPVTLHETLGSGGSGAVVYRASIHSMTFAAKILRLEHVDEVINAFKNEVEIVRSLNHPNIIRYLGHAYLQNEIRLFLEFFSHTARDLVLERQQRNDPFSVLQIRDMVFQTVKAVSYLHSKSIMHRDVKTENLFLHLDGHSNVQTVKLGDMDTCVKLDSDKRTRSQGTGTIAFAAPETLRLDKAGYTVAADIWSLGVVLAELISLRIPLEDIKPSDRWLFVESGKRLEFPAEIIQRKGMDVLVNLYKACTEFEPEKRLTADGAKLALISSF